MTRLIIYGYLFMQIIFDERQTCDKDVKIKMSQCYRACGKILVLAKCVPAHHLVVASGFAFVYLSLAHKQTNKQEDKSNPSAICNLNKHIVTSASLPGPPGR